MSADPRAALSVLVSAFERHLEACAGRRGEDDPTVAFDSCLHLAKNETRALSAQGSRTMFAISVM